MFEIGIYHRNWYVYNLWVRKSSQSIYCTYIVLLMQNMWGIIVLSCDKIFKMEKDIDFDGFLGFTSIKRDSNLYLIERQLSPYYFSVINRGLEIVWTYKKWFRNHVTCIN